MTGTVEVSQAKNAALPIMAAALLAEGKTVIKGCPRLADVVAMSRILRSLGSPVKRSGEDVVIRTPKRLKTLATYELVRKMRASFCVLGPLLGRERRATVSLPGGCIIGARPVDLHLKGMRALGVKIDIDGGYVLADGSGLHGGSVYLGGPFGSTVLGTANVMMAATLAEGRTMIESAACEPEIVNLAEFLNGMGARIRGAGSPRVVVEGVEALHGIEHRVVPDRIEAGTFMIAAAITNGEIVLKNVRMDHLMAVAEKLREVGVVVEATDGVAVISSARRLSPVDVTTQPYPGFPTDLQAQLMTLLSLADGNSVITEKVFPDRFMHVAELLRMGANIRKEGPTAIVTGVRQLIGAPVMASDLRASAALVLAGLVARGRTVVSRVYHIDRGYERIERKLAALGADIRRVSE